MWYLDSSLDAPPCRVAVSLAAVPKQGLEGGNWRATVHSAQVAVQIPLKVVLDVHCAGIWSFLPAILETDEVRLAGVDCAAPP